MAEILAVSSGVAGLLSLTVELAQISSQYIGNIRNAHGVTRSYLSELSDLQRALRKLKRAVTNAQASGNLQPESFLHDLKTQGIEECTKQLEKTKEKLEKRIRKPNTYNRLTWPFREEETRRVVEMLRRCKALFSDAMSNEVFYISTEILHGVKRCAALEEEVAQEAQIARKKLKTITEIGEKALEQTNEMHSTVTKAAALGEEILGESRRAESRCKTVDMLNVLTWLTSTDPSTNHLRARKSCQEGTGRWFLESNDYLSWLRQEHAVLWLYGIPGSGKTVLASTILEDLKTKQRKEASVLYFYFDFSDPNKQNPDDFLRSLIRQLASSQESLDKPDKEWSVQSLYDKYALKGHHPGTRNLLNVLWALMETHAHITIVVDALDECPDRIELVERLVEMTERYERTLSLLLTSRENSEISTGLDEIPRTHIRKFCLHEASSSTDIQHYIREQLRCDLILSRRTAEEKLEIELALVKGACGMHVSNPPRVCRIAAYVDRFRWVSCQFVSLRKCRTPKELIKSLKCLPRTLEESYARILAGIDNDDRATAIAALEWLVFSRRPLTIQELAEASVLRGESAVDPSARLFDAKDILTICSGLVTSGPSAKFGFSSHIVVRLAHLSVQEYLLSERASLSNHFLGSVMPGMHWFSEHAAHRRMTEQCVLYMCSSPPGGQPVKARDLEDYPLLDYAGRHWQEHAIKALHMCDAVEDLVLLLMRFLDNKNEFFMNWLRIHLPGVPFGGTFDESRTLKTVGVASPLEYALNLKLDAVACGLIRANARDARADVSLNTALESAIKYGLSEAAMLLLDRGASIPSARILQMLLRHAGDNEAFVTLIRKILGHPHHEGAHHAIWTSYVDWLEDDHYITNLVLNNTQIISSYYRNQSGTERKFGVTSRILPKFTVNSTGTKDRALSAWHAFKGAAESYTSPPGLEELIDIFVGRGIDVNSKGQRTGLTLIQKAVAIGDKRMVETLLKTGVEVEQPFEYGSTLSGTLLHRAIIGGWPGIVEALLVAGASLAAKARYLTHTALSPLWLAYICNKVGVFAPLRRFGVSMNEISDFRDSSCAEGTVLHRAVLDGASPVFCLSLVSDHDVNVNVSAHIKSDVLGNAIHLAIIQNKDILAMRLIELSSTDVNAALHSRNGEGPFHGITLIQLAALQRKLILVETLVRRGAKTSSPCWASALQIAAATNQTGIVRALLRAGALIDEHGPFGTAYYIAAHEGHEGTLQILRKGGAKEIPSVSAYIDDRDGETFDRFWSLSDEPGEKRNSRIL